MYLYLAIITERSNGTMLTKLGKYAIDSKPRPETVQSAEMKIKELLSNVNLINELC